MRMPAACNVLGATDLAVRPINPASRPTLIVADFFGIGPLDPHVDAIYNSALRQTGHPDQHGYHVVGIAAADFPDDGTNAGVVTGVFPSTTVLSPIDLTGTSFLETSILILLRATLQPGHIVVNTSQGYPDFLPTPFDPRMFASEWARSSTPRRRCSRSGAMKAPRCAQSPPRPASIQR